MIKMFVSKIFRGLGYFATTVMSKLQHGDKLKVEGVFRKRHDTQIILQNDGKMQLGKSVSFQRNVSLSSCELPYFLRLNHFLVL